MSTRELIRATLNFWKAMGFLIVLEMLFSLAMIYYKDIEQLPNDGRTAFFVVVIMVFNLLLALSYVSDKMSREA